MKYGHMNAAYSNFGSFKRADGEEFFISAKTYETTPDINYWTTLYTITHKVFPPVSQLLFIKKELVPTFASALSISALDPLEQIKSNARHIDGKGLDSTLVLSSDGVWYLK